MQIRKGNVPASLLARVHSLFCIYSAPARHEIARRAMNGITCIQTSEAVPSLSAWRNRGASLYSVFVGFSFNYDGPKGRGQCGPFLRYVIWEPVESFENRISNRLKTDLQPVNNSVLWKPTGKNRMKHLLESAYLQIATGRMTWNGLLKNEKLRL